MKKRRNQVTNWNEIRRLRCRKNQTVPALPILAYDQNETRVIITDSGCMEEFKGTESPFGKSGPWKTWTDVIEEDCEICLLYANLQNCDG